MEVPLDIHSRSAVPKAKSQLQDDSIMGTNNSSITSKRSVERLYYPNEPHFFRYFVKKPQRRSPLINRGYWLRMKAVDEIVRQFLDQASEKKKVVINLGCGYDPLPWQCMARYPDKCCGVQFIDIDYKDLMVKKREMVISTEELSFALSSMEVPDDDELVLLRSDQYIQLGCDLRDIKLLDQILTSVVDIENRFILFTAEVSITYMDVDAADNLIEWAGKFPDARFCLLEQIIPDGIDHPFARTMMAHFAKLRTPLGAVQKYPTTVAQEIRFKGLGWTEASACNLWRLWNDPRFIDSKVRMTVNSTEPFDEWEEFALFGCHYFLLVASTSGEDASWSFSKNVLPASVEFPANETSAPYLKPDIEVAYSENPKSQGCRRFGAVLPLRSSARVGVFGGMGLVTRMNTYDVYGLDVSNGTLPINEAGSSVPLNRMCHTLTDLGDIGALLVGGRTSPDNALADCWLYHKWVDTWERVDDIPCSLYRHGAAALGDGLVLITPGKFDSRNINTDFYIWSRALGWVKCIRSPGLGPLPSHGVTFTSFDEPASGSQTRRGLLAGGISEDGLLLGDENTWEWELKGFSSTKPTISFQQAAEIVSTPTSGLLVARFGAQVVHFQGRYWIGGGIIKNEILRESMEFVLVDDYFRVSPSISLKRPHSVPRHLLIGSSLVSVGDSLLVVGGSAVCFSFGTFWSKGCYTLRNTDYKENWKQSAGESTPTCWKFLHTATVAGSVIAPSSRSAVSTVSLQRIRIASASAFDQIIRSGKPVIIEGLDIGPCTSKWTSDYLKRSVGSDREVVVHAPHEATTQHMDFQSKNFKYSTRSFGEFIDQIDAGQNLYLRSLSTEKPTELPADISRDFPGLSDDFGLPAELTQVQETAHSCPLRVSGPVNMWLHYDVMANVLCQVRGSKHLLIFPPSDVRYLGFAPGASSSSINVFDNPIPHNTHPHEAFLTSGDVLFLPPLWLHAASPSSGMSVAVNVFFRNLRSGYAAGKDVYGNRDLQAYEKGRQDVSKVIKSFAYLPPEAREFYLQRLAREFEELIR